MKDVLGNELRGGDVILHARSMRGALGLERADVVEVRSTGGVLIRYGRKMRSWGGGGQEVWLTKASTNRIVRIESTEQSGALPPILDTERSAEKPDPDARP